MTEWNEPRDCVIEIVSLINGGRTAFDGQFVVEYDASRSGTEPIGSWASTGRPMLCHLVTTPDVDKATRYGKVEAMELWRSVDQRNPVRADGQPNRPLTAFTVSIGPPEKALGKEFIDRLIQSQEEREWPD